MKKILRKIIKRKVMECALLMGATEINRCVDFITNAPIWQWKKRLWLVRTVIGYGERTDFDWWLRFFDE